MLSSLAQALGLDFTFFVQFLLFLLVYPVVSYWLLGPYMDLQNKREKQTLGAKAVAEHLRQEAEKLRLQYQQKAREVHGIFNQQYQKGSQQLKMKYLHESQDIKKQLRLEFVKNQEQLKQELITADKKLFLEIPTLTQKIVQILLKEGV